MMINGYVFTLILIFGSMYWLYAMGRFDNFQQRIDRMEADADLVNYGRKTSLADQFKELETDDDIEKELEALEALLTNEPARHHQPGGERL